MGTKTEKILQKGWVVSLLATFCCLLWGSAFPSIKVGYEWFRIGSSDTAAQILFAGMRFALAGVLVILLGSLLHREFLRPRLSSLPRIGKICLMQTVIQYFFFYVGLAHTTGVKGSIVESSNVFFAILFSSLLFRQEKMSGKKLLGCIVGFAGVVLVNLGGGGEDLRLQSGDLYILISAAAYGMSSVLIKKYSQWENPVMLSGYQFLAGGLLMMAGAFAAGGRITVFTPAGGAILLYMALISAVAYTLWGVLLKYNPVSRVSIFGFTNPVFGVLLSALILHEGGSFGMTGVAALVLVCAGIFIVNYERQGKKTES